MDFSGLSRLVDGALFWPMPEAPIPSAAPAPEPAPIAPVSSPQAELQLEADPIAPPPADPALQTPPTGQLLLGTDKRNPVFAVIRTIRAVTTR